MGHLRRCRRGRTRKKLQNETRLETTSRSRNEKRLWVAGRPVDPTGPGGVLFERSRPSGSVAARLPSDAEGGPALRPRAASAGLPRPRPRYPRTAWPRLVLPWRGRLTKADQTSARHPRAGRERLRVPVNEVSTRSEWCRIRTCYSQIRGLVLSPVELTTRETAFVRTRSRNARGPPPQRDPVRRRPGQSLHRKTQTVAERFAARGATILLLTVALRS